MWLTTEEACARAGISRAWLSVLVKCGDVRSQRRGRRRYYDSASLDQWKSTNKEWTDGSR